MIYLASPVNVRKEKRNNRSCGNQPMKFSFSNNCQSKKRKRNPKLLEHVVKIYSLLVYFVMGEEIDSEVIKKTQEILGSIIKRPALSEKSLKKPPFRFLHDIITNVRVV